MPAVIIVGTWREMGYYMLLFLAGLQTIPAQLYEAAQVDGASAWQRFWHVTVPGAAPHDVLRDGAADHRQSSRSSTSSCCSPQGGPGQSTLVLSQYIYQKGFEENQFGYASAISIVLFAICFGITVVQYLVNKRRNA